MNVLFQNLKKTSLLHPILFSIFPIIFLYVHNIHVVPFHGFIVPLILSILVTLFLLAIARAILKNNYKAGFIVSLFVFLFLIFGHITNLITSDESIGELNDSIIFGMFIIIIVGGGYYFVRTKRKLDNATIITNSIAVVLVVMMLVNIATHNFENSFSIESSDSVNDFNLKLNENAINPDVYFFMLDGYSNHKILQKYFDYDNQKFIDSLREQGFFVSNEYTSSNYPWTYMSVSSFLNIKYVNEFDTSDVNSPKEEEPLYKIIDNNIVMQNFKELGYKNISFDSGWHGTRVVDIADQNLCENPNVDWLALHQIKEATILPTIKELNKIIGQQIHEQKRQQIFCIFDELIQITEKTKGPVFVFTHIMAPHPSWVFDSDGDKPVELVSVKSKDINKRKLAYIAQMEFANKKVIESINKILSESESEPIIIILSDHGTRIVEDKQTADERDVIKYGNFMAFYLPNYNESFGYPKTPVNVFRIIFNSYFNGEFEILEDRVFYGNNKEIKNWNQKVSNVFG